VGPLEPAGTGWVRPGQPRPLLTETSLQPRCQRLGTDMRTYTIHIADMQVNFHSDPHPELWS